jgi:outer membrane protein assembly factor BamB
MAPYRNAAEMPATADDLVFVGCGGRVAAVDNRNGRLLWQQKLVGTNLPISIHCRGGRLFAGSCGRVWCLDPLTGSERWYYDVSKGSSMGNFVSILLERDTLLAASGGHLACLDPETGAARWRNGLRGFGMGNVTLATARGSAQQDAISREEAQNAAALAMIAAAAATSA